MQLQQQTPAFAGQYKAEYDIPVHKPKSGPPAKKKVSQFVLYNMTYQTEQCQGVTKLPCLSDFQTKTEAPPEPSPFSFNTESETNVIFSEEWIEGADLGDLQSAMAAFGLRAGRKKEKALRNELKNKLEELTAEHGGGSMEEGKEEEA